MTKMTPLADMPVAPTSWASAGIVDARLFTIGEANVLHELSHASPNRVRGRCGVTAPVVESDRPLASWASGYVTGQRLCPTCITVD